MDSMGMTRILVKYSHSQKVTGKGTTRMGDHLPVGTFEGIVQDTAELTALQGAGA